MENYDPNIKPAIQKVKLVFMCWGYKKEEIIEVRGYSRGLDAIKFAVELLNDSLPTKNYLDENDLPCASSYMVLTNSAGEELLIEDEELKYDEFLYELLVSAEILNIEAQS